MAITEVYSPERFNSIASRFNLKPGTSFDLANGWDFNVDADRKKAWNNSKEEEPELIVGSPPCTMLSPLQTLSIAMNHRNKKWTSKRR